LLLPSGRLTCISHRLSSRSAGEGGGCKACDPSASSGQAEARVEEVHPERPFAKGRRSVTQQTPAYPPMQQRVGEKRRLTIEFESPRPAFAAMT
jgi:hypothetical protein